MGAGVVIWFWLFIAAVGAALWIGSLWLFVDGRRKQSRARSWFGGVPLVLGSLLTITTVGGAIYGFIWNSQPENIYEMSFGSMPTKDVTNLQSSFYNFADTGNTFLKFEAAPGTIDNLTSKGWPKLAGKEWENEVFYFFQNDSKPDWWRPTKTEDTQIFVARDRFKIFAGESEILIYDPKTKQTHYAFIGID